MRHLILVLLFGVAACASTDNGATTELETEIPFQTAVSRGGNYLLGWRPVERADVPVNEHFELDAYLAPASDPTRRITEARLVVSAWMPDHGHGMVTKPQAVVEGDGYRIKGMLFHMGGYWQLFFDVLEGEGAERAEFRLDL